MLNIERKKNINNLLRIVKSEYCFEKSDGRIKNKYCKAKKYK